MTTSISSSTNPSQGIRSNCEVLTCTSKEFNCLLSMNHRFPPKVIVTDNLHIKDSDIETLPTGLEVEGNFDLNGCNLTSVPQGLKVKGNVEFRVCCYLISCPAGVEVGGNLFFLSCLSLTSFSQGLKVRGDLFIRGCSSLVSMSEDLEVEGDFDLYECSSFTSLPERLKVKGNLNFKWCSLLTSLPAWITTLGPRADGRTREINLENTGLSDAIIDRLRQTPAPGIRFFFSHRATNPTVEFPDLKAALSFWLTEVKDKVLDIPNIVIDREQDSVNVIRFLARLTTTAEYQNPQTRKHLACRVLEAFIDMEQNDEIKARACDLIHQGLTSCDDRIIFALEEIELMVLLYKIENTNHTAEELKKLGKSFLLLEMVNAKAKAHKETLTWVDEIEIYLAFQIGLADRFDLPVKTRNMFFRGCAQVTNDQLQAFGDEIEQACTDEKLETFLKTWSPWMKHQLKVQVVPSYEELAIADRELADDDTCAITLCAPDEPVLYNGRVYDYGSFVHQYRTSGTDPIDRSKIDISQLKRIIKK